MCKGVGVVVREIYERKAERLCKKEEASGDGEERMGEVRDNSVRTAATFPVAVIK